MKVIIIEDEKAAVRNLKALLQEVKPEVEVEATLDSIAAVCHALYAGHDLYGYSFS